MRADECGIRASASLPNCCLASSIFSRRRNDHLTVRKVGWASGSVWSNGWWKCTEGKSRPIVRWDKAASLSCVCRSWRLAESHAAIGRRSSR